MLSASPFLLFIARAAILFSPEDIIYHIHRVLAYIYKHSSNIHIYLFIVRARILPSPEDPTRTANARQTHVYTACIHAFTAPTNLQIHTCIYTRLGVYIYTHSYTHFSHSPSHTIHDHLRNVLSAQTYCLQSKLSLLQTRAHMRPCYIRPTTPVLPLWVSENLRFCCKLIFFFLKNPSSAKGLSFIHTQTHISLSHTPSIII